VKKPDGKLRIYNTLAGKKEVFSPITSNKVSMYVCGPTVYDEAHIGHARGAFVFDVARNYLTYKGYKVKFVRNVTDVDDKIIEKARMLAGPQGDLRAKVKEVASKYLKSYREDMKALGIGAPDEEPRATDHIKDMIKLIRGLLDNGYAYRSGGDIYFRVRKFKDYGKLSHQGLEKMEVGARIQPGEGKEDPLDFALWKRSKEREPSWQEGDVEGRPGWHIECSAMSTASLGQTFDIHGGGVDLIFPHHENEIAQSEAYSGREFSRYWMHNGLLTIEGQKMAKSLGNFLTVKDFLATYGDPDILKIFFLSTHYRSPVDFSRETIEAAGAAKKRFTRFFEAATDFVREIGARRKIGGAAAGGRRFRSSERLAAEFERGMDDDFNTAYALGALFNFGVNKGYDIINRTGRKTDKKRAEELLELVFVIRALGDALDLSFEAKKAPDKVKEVVEQKLKIRQEARARRDYGEADRIRDELDSLGVVVEDTPKGPRWRMK